MITLIRREVRDPLLDRDGNSISKTRFDADAIQAALKHASMHLQRVMRLVNPSDGYTYTDGTYTAGAVSVAIPGAGTFDPIVKVENISDTSKPIYIPAVPFDEIERYAIADSGSAYVPRGLPYRCCLVEGTVPDRHLLIRPRPVAALAIRVWRVGAPIIWTSAEAQPLAAHWEDLMVLLAAQELLGRLEGMNPDQNARLALIMDDFRGAANRRRQPQRIGRKRVGWS